MMPDVQAAGHLTEHAARALSALVVRAFLAALPEQQQHGGTSGLDPPAVRVLTVAGMPPEKSFTMPGRCAFLVLLWLASSATQEKLDGPSIPRSGSRLSS